MRFEYNDPMQNARQLSTHIRLLTLLLGISCIAVNGQNSAASSQSESVEQSFAVPLTIHSGIVQSMFRGISFESHGADPVTVELPGQTAVQVRHMSDGSPAVEVHIPEAEPTKSILLPGQKTLLRLPRRVSNAEVVPYLLGLQRSERDGKIRESLTWQPVYRAEGKLKLPGCEVSVYVLDFNGDGRFDAVDSRSATTLGLDLNGDGRLWGSAEYNSMNQIVEVCGTPLEVGALDPSGNNITFRRSRVPPVAVGGPLPEFQLLTSGGQTLRSSSFRDKVHVLDFWASWCAPCVEKLDELDRIARESAADLAVVGVNVDGPDRRSLAEKMMAEKRLSFPQVIRGLGDEDYVWKMFGSMEGAHLSIPLYVVIDRNGRIAYAAGGGEQLRDLKAAIELARAGK